MAEVPERAEVVIVGGGVIGLAIACHLGWRGVRDLVLLERHTLTSGTSWHAAGIIGPLRASLNLTRLAVSAIETFARLERETGQATGYRRTGGLWLAQTEARMQELRRIADIGGLAGLTAEIVAPEAAVARLPQLSPEELAGGLWVAEDGQADPVGVCMAYAAAARAAGVRIVENAPVAEIETARGGVTGIRLADGRRIRCAVAVNATGAWARSLAARSGVALPLQAVEHMYVVTEPLAGLPQPCPILRDLDGRIYIKEDAGRLVLGGFEPDAKLLDLAAPGLDAPFLELPEDWDQFEPFLQAGLTRVPVLAGLGIQHFMNGPESFTPDTKPLLGEAPECRGYFVAAGFNSLGIVSSAGAGKAMAEWIADGAPALDLADLDIARMAPEMAAPDFLASRTAEAVGSQFDMHWPFKRMETGRGLRLTPTHDLARKRGAVFGSPAGWERPLWFGPPDEDASYSFADQPWWQAAERESLAVRDGAVLVDLSPFSKFEIGGPEALADLQALCSADLDIPPGRSKYALLLNPQGGIEAEATVQRLAATRFLMVGAAPSHRRDLRWLTRHLTEVAQEQIPTPPHQAGAGREGGTLIDRTRDEAVLGLFGPRAAEIWRSAEGSPEAIAMPFGAFAECSLAGHRVRALRLSYIGEFGWEIYLPWGDAADLAGRILALGAQQMGLHAVDACRMEKGFRHWGHDIGPCDTPLETGLGWAVAWEKGPFLGREALARQRADRPARRLLQFAVEGAHPLLLHDEPVLRDGTAVGHTTSGARGFRTGLSLCFASIATRSGETAASLATSSFEVSVAGQRHPLRLLTAPPYDPTGARMRQTPGDRT